MSSFKQIIAPIVFICIALLRVDVAEGYFLSSVQRNIEKNDSLRKPPDKENEEALIGEDQEGKNYQKKQSTSKAVTVKYPFIHKLDKALAKVFGPTADIWYMDWKLWVGMFLWLSVWAKWLKQGYDDEIYGLRALYAFGLNILILHILQYVSSIRFGMFIICVVLGLQALFQSCVWFKSAAEQSHEMDDFVCDTLYLDLMLPFEQIAVLFLAQIGVWWFYMTSILGNFNLDHVNYLFWLWSFLAMQMTMIFNRGADSVLGNAFPVHDVHRMYKSAATVTFTLQDAEGEKAVPFALSKADILARGIMGYWCNSILREIMAYTIPLMLMGFSEPMDFVVYCVGVNFICTLDDMSERKYSLTAANE